NISIHLFQRIFPTISFCYSAHHYHKQNDCEKKITTRFAVHPSLAGLKHCRLHNHSSLLSPPSLSLSIQAPAQDLQPLLEPTQLPPLQGRLTISTGRISFFLTLPFGDAQEPCQ